MIKHDYKPQSNQKLLNSSLELPEWLTHPYLILGTAVSVLFLAIVLSLPEAEEEPIMAIEQANEIIQLEINEPQSNNYSAPIDIPLEIKKVQEAIKTMPLLSQDIRWKVESVKKGDSLSKIFKRIGLSPQQLYQVINLDDNTKLLKNLRPGEAVSYQLGEDNKIIALKYAISIQKTLYIEAKQSELISRIENKTIEYQTAYSRGVITDSLFVAGKKSGLTDTQIMQLAGIFGWDIDFILDIRKGDSFSMLYEEKYLDGEKIGNGNIIAAEFINRGEVFRAVRYTDSNNSTDYYSDDGHSMRKAFLRAPVNFKYISDSFNPKRFHPVQKRIKPHRGIDYAARVGTPISAAGDGRVIASGYNKFNGKYIFIQHGNNIVTKYLHLSKRMVSKGKRVKQGQTIGKLGSTGMVTGPHLHYEFVVNGVHRNPRTVSLPKAKPIAKSEKSRFVQETAPWLTQLASRNSIQNDTQKVAFD